MSAFASAVKPQPRLAGAASDSGGMTSQPRYSIIPARAVFDERLSANEIRVLCALGTYSDREGWCWPSQKSLTDRLGLSRSTVGAAIKRLSSPEIGYVDVRSRVASGRGKVGNEYRVKMDLPPNEIPMSKSPDIGEKPVSETLDIGPQQSSKKPMCEASDIGADVQPLGHPMSKSPDIGINNDRTTPIERPQLVLGEIIPLEKPKAKKVKSTDPYTPEFEAVWKLWPANRRGRSDKRAAFTKFLGNLERYTAERIENAARFYLSDPQTKKEDFKYCCLVEVFMNGKLDGAVEVAEEAPSRKPKGPYSGGVRPSPYIRRAQA